MLSIASDDPENGQPLWVCERIKDRSSRTSKKTDVANVCEKEDWQLREEKKEEKKRKKNYRRYCTKGPVLFHALCNSPTS